MNAEGVIESLIRWARTSEDIRCVLLTGSRAENSKRLDEFSDFDVLLFVDNVENVVGREDWVEWRGPALVRYRETRDAYGYGVAADLVLYEDGVKMDFTVAPYAALQSMVETGTLPDDLDVGYRTLVDEDGITARLPEPSGSAYIPKAPHEEEYLDLVGEFWWETFYVAKSLVRRELLPAKYSLDSVMKLQLLRRALEWWVGVESDWRVPTGALGRGLADQLEPELWSELEKTYVGSGMEENWEALLRTTELFERVAREVGEALGFEYPEELSESARTRLIRIREKGAT
jgi:aminoglycoside 6-adenylyltransferase